VTGDSYVFVFNRLYIVKQDEVWKIRDALNKHHVQFRGRTLGEVLEGCGGILLKEIDYPERTENEYQ